MNSAQPFALVGARIFDGHQFFNQHALLVEQDRVVALMPKAEIPAHYRIEQVAGGLLTPGFIDLQINGAGGAQFNNAISVQSLVTMSQAMLQFGVTRILPTLISDTAANTEAAIHTVKKARETIDGILGIHIEGPFFSEQKNGVHSLDFIRPIAEQDWSWLQQLADLPSLLTLAPEQVSAAQIGELAALNIRLCAGHSNANYQQVKQAVDAGLSGFTHLFNAMSPMSGREPGMVGAALSLKQTWAGIIADGFHVHPNNIQLALDSKGWQKIFLVSDAMATVGSAAKSFQLYGETIFEQDGQLKNAQGKLAGSAISLLDALHYCVKTLELPLEKSLAMASRIPAEYMQLDHQFGSFKTNAIADIVHLSDELEVISVWQSGRKQSEPTAVP